MDSDATYKVAERTKEALRQDTVMQQADQVKMLKLKLAVMETVLKDTIALMKQQSLKANQAVFSLRTQLKEQNELIFSLRCERGCILKKLISSLLFIEGEFRKEQKEILDQLYEKDRLIQETLRELNYWKTRNPEGDKNNSLPTNLNVQQVQEDLNTVEKDSCTHFNEILDRLNCKNNELNVQNLPSDPVSFTNLDSEKANCKVNLGKPHLAQSAQSSEHQFQSEQEKCSPDTGSIPGNHQTTEIDGSEKDELAGILFRRRYMLHGSYERLTDIGERGSNKQFKKNLNNHRSVVRPRDVKYKRTSRSHTRTCQ
ncbi:uncharacterized protein LOC111088032 [Limulus polyphemus]|uniref:Uncharacterized protein LOC111088032 n=1 Tax=Limulus polyphemus TaxID=6850 RepID=A0ABM1T9E5_LIMPO|nr:uncharacterized protein LOC111088032 [Limulus polyphemus]